jgi:bacterial/archaeal transporter family-2 protein
MQQILLMVLAILAGAVLPIQVGLNTKIGQVMESPILASLISFFTGTVAMLLYVLIARVPLQLVSNAKNVSPVLWLAGFLGAFYVTSTILIAPRLGVALTFGLIVAGQMLVSLLFDQFGWLGLPVKEISLMRILGTLLLIIGVILIRKY